MRIACAGQPAAAGMLRFARAARGPAGARTDALSSAMADSPIDRLTPAQLACLRLLPALGTYKRIAQQLDISPGTVAQHITEARRRLGDVSRFEAAAMVVEWETEHPHKSYIRSQSIDPTASLAMLEVPMPQAPVPGQAHLFRETPISFRPGDVVESLGPARLFRLWIRRLIDDLTGPDRSRGAFRLALMIAVITLVLVAIANTIQVTLQVYTAHP